MRGEIAESMEPRIHFIGVFLLIVHVINVESHPRHENSHKHGHKNKLLTDFSDDVVSYLNRGI